MRPLVASAVLLAAAVAVAAPPSAARSAAPWDASPLSAAPSAIARAAAALPIPAGADRQVLLDERVYHIAADNSSERRSHIVFRVLTAAGVSTGPGLEISWQPWCEARPEVRVRVISPDGTSHALDPATIEDAGVSLGESLYSDGRVLRAPYPALTVGAVVEQEIVERRLPTPFVAAAADHTELLGQFYPSEHTRVVVDAPTTLPLRWSVHGPIAATPVRRVAAERTTLTFDVGPRPALELVAGAPMDQLLPLLSFSTGGSWQDVARSYGRIAEAELARTPRAELEKTARAALGATPVGDRARVAAALLAFVRHKVRPVGIEFGHSSIVPHVPGDTLQRQYGDCKDQALLLVGLLRAVGVPAQLALLRVTGVDVDDKLPGFERFDHVIVYLPGAEPLWIDSTDEWARVNDLPPRDQGRLALVVDPATRALVRTPLAPPDANRMVSTRDIFLAEAGRARVAEKLEMWGLFDRAWRTVMTAGDGERMRQALESSVASSLGSQKITRYQATDARRLDLPMRIELEVTDSPIAYTSNEGADVLIEVARIPDDLPDWMRQDDGKRRGSLDFVVAQMGVFESRYHVTPPPGLKLAALPADGDVPLGPLRLTKRFSREADGSVLAVLRVEVRKTRFSPTEIAAVRAACKSLASSEPTHLRFVDVAHADLVAGRLREALEAYRRLIALHPKEAVHHQDLALALLGVGLGEPARAEAMRAVALEPKNTAPLHTLAWVLERDLVGRRFAPGFDRAGAEAALRRAQALDPNDAYAHLDLGVLLEYDAEGRRYASAAGNVAALAEYRAVDKETIERLGYADDPLWDLAHLQRWKELEQATRGHADNIDHARLRLMAVAAQSGVPAALTEAATLPADLRTEAVRGAAEWLLWMRMYPQAAGLFERASQEPDAPAWITARGDLARRLRRIEDAPIDERDPASAVRHLYLELLRPDDEANLIKRLRALTTSDAAVDPSDERSMMLARRSWRAHELPYEVLRDALVTVGVAEKDGDDRTGWRVRYTKPMNAGVDTQFVVRDHGRWRLFGFRQQPVQIAHRILAAVARGDFAGARRWADWGAEYFRNGDPIDRNELSPVARVWNPAAEGTPEQARVAALMMLVGHTPADDKLALDGLRAVAASPPPGVPRDAVELMIARALNGADRAEEALAAAAASSSPSRLWFGVRANALAKLKRWDELRRAADAELARAPDDTAAQEARLRADKYERRWEALPADLERLVAAGHARPTHYNDIAWTALFAQGADEHALDAARRAVELSHRRDGGILHTLAAVDAGLGRNREAYTTLLESIDAGDGKLFSGDYYVLGRIAENLGLPDVALADYRKVAPADAKKPSPFDTSELAGARIRALAR